MPCPSYDPSRARNAPDGRRRSETVNDGVTTTLDRSRDATSSWRHRGRSTRPRRASTVWSSTATPSVRSPRAPTRPFPRKGHQQLQPQRLSYRHLALVTHGIVDQRSGGLYQSAPRLAGPFVTTLDLYLGPVTGGPGRAKRRSCTSRLMVSLAVLIVWLPLFRRYRLDCGGEPCMRFWVNLPVLHLGTRRAFTKIVVAFPVLRRPDGSLHEATTAARTHVVQDVVNTRGTERTLIGTDACVE